MQDKYGDSSSSVRLLQIPVVLMSLCSFCLPILAETPGFDTDQLEPCAFMDPPEIADGVYASSSVMEKMGKDVRNYVGAIQISLACLETVSEEVGPEGVALINQIYNNGVDQLDFIVEQYNTQVQVYKREKENSRIRKL